MRSWIYNDLRTLKTGSVSAVCFLAGYAEQLRFTALSN